MKFFEIKTLKEIEQLHSVFEVDSGEGQAISEAVRTILREVKSKGDGACVAFTATFDGVKIDKQSQELARDKWITLADSLSQELKEALQIAATNITKFHAKQIHTGYEFSRDGVTVGQRILPIERVGIYIPGGRAKYPSTVLMTAIPAKLAGVKELVMVSPPDKESGEIDPALLYAAIIAGVDRIYKIGGAQAIAALAFGTESIPKVDKIVGPGNAYVAEAKRQVFGRVGIDLIAGPSEIAIISDGSVNTEWLVQDMFAQMEHDPMTRTLVVNSDKAQLEAMKEMVEEKIEFAPRSEILNPSWAENCFFCYTPSEKIGVEIINLFAPEHVQIMTKNPRKTMESIKHAGAIFLGQYAPVPMGDYIAGPNHTLPTAACARFASPLGVYDFIRHQDIIEYTEESCATEAPFVNKLARSETLENHALSAMLRLEKKQ